MAKAKATKQNDKVDIKNIFSDYVKNEGKGKFELFDESSMTEIKGWISTGSPALNSIMGGNYFKAIPKGRITAFAGRPGVGKSFIVANIIREAQSQGMGVIFFETENAVDRAFLERLGVDTSTILYQPATTITSWEVDVCQTLESLHTQHPNVEWLVITDSLANLTSEKEHADVKKGDVKSDQGQRAKQLKAASRIVQKAVAFNNATMVVTNHTYEVPGAYPGVPPEEVFTGGQGFIFMCTQIVFLRKYHEKEEGNQLSDNKKKKFVTGARIVATVVKNRIVPEGKQAQFYISFKTGLQKYPGLLEDALKHGLIEKASAGWWQIPHLDKKVRTGNLYEDEIWEPIIEPLSEKVEQELAYSEFHDKEVMEEMAEAAGIGSDSDDDHDD
jgi:recombination protein RecA